ncbi:hypothetical protein ACVWZR_000214 [Bradyrhizobium sp. i1.3.1]
MAEEPEQMLPEQHVAPLGRIEEMRADETVEDQAGAGNHDCRHRHDHEKGRHQHCPDEHRNAVERHAGRALFEDRDHQLNRDGERGHLSERDHLRPDVGALAGGILRAGQRNIGEPTDIRPHVESESAPEQCAAGEINPVGKGVQTRKGDVAGADHQRNEIDRDRFHHGHGEKEHHVGAVHGEDLVVTVGTEQARLRLRELDSHQGGQHAAEGKEDEGREDVAAADDLVIDGCKRAPESGWRFPRLL